MILLSRVFQVENNVFGCGICNRNVLVERDRYASSSVHKAGTYFDIVVFARDGCLSSNGQRVAVVVEQSSVYMIVLVEGSIEELNSKLTHLFQDISSTAKYRDVRQIRFAAMTSIDLSAFMADHRSSWFSLV